MNKYYSTEKITNKIHMGECLDFMDRIPDSSIHMILCDLPYGSTRCKWDVPIDLVKLWDRYSRIIKPNGVICLTGAQPFTSLLVCSNIKNFKYDFCWVKPKGTGHLNAKKMPLRDKEDILIFSYGKNKYNPQFSKGTPYSRKKAGFNNRISNPGQTTYGRFKEGQDSRNDNDGFRYPKQTLHFGVVERNLINQTQKPVALFEYLIKTYTDEGEIVMDNCSGSGTTAIACVNTNRKFICIEKDEIQYLRSNERLQHHYQTLQL